MIKTKNELRITIVAAETLVVEDNRSKAKDKKWNYDCVLKR